MSTPGTVAPGGGALELPPFSLDVQALDLGDDVKAVGLELVETQNREPVRGKDAAAIWSAVFPALAGDEPYVVDFFSHVERVREFCKTRQIALREATERCVVLPRANQEQLRQIFERFEAKHSASERARHRNPSTPPSKAICQSAGWTPISRPMPGIPCAPSASRRTAG